MKFEIGGTLYRVRVAEEQLYDDEGRQVPGLFDWHARTIWLSAEVAPQNREDVLFHELGHAWEHHYGLPADGEGRANSQSSFIRQLVRRQYDRQGGTWTLMRLRADGVIDTNADVGDAGPTVPAHGGDCGICGTRFSTSRIVSSPPRHDPDVEAIVIDRLVYCAHCDKNIAWSETATPTGVPTGRVVRGPHYFPATDPGNEPVVVPEWQA